MTYGANPRNPASNLPFNNVVVNRSSYRQFIDTGEWLAVDQTFVQFYPTLFDVAKAKGTVKPTWKPHVEAPAAGAH
jgi:hypothetical protein